MAPVFLPLHMYDKLRRTRHNKGEWLVAEKLMQDCPDDWIIIYSKEWLWAQNEIKYNN